MPVALEQPQVHHSAQTPRLRRARRVVAIAIRLTILAAIVAIFAAVIIWRDGDLVVNGGTASWKSYTNAASKLRSDG
jgi:hypothetical protein